MRGGLLCLEFLRNSVATLIAANSTHQCLTNASIVYNVAGAAGVLVTGLMVYGLYSSGRKLVLG